MNSVHLQAVIIACAAVVLAVCLGISVATENYILLAFGACIAIGLILIVIPNYAPLLAFGTLCPIAAPIPFISAFPFIAIILGICIVKYVLQRALVRHSKQREISTMIWPFGVLFAWVLFRYCLNPALPNVRGYGENVTGFRSYLNYSICFGIIFFLGRFVVSQAALLKLIRWLARWSVAFSIAFIIIMFSRSAAVSGILISLGVYIETYDNGVFRFVVLPGFGVILLTLVQLPQLFPCRRWIRYLTAILACAAIVLGGNRSSLAMAVAVVIVIPFLKQRFLRFGVRLAVIAFGFAAAYWAGEMLSQRQDVALLRVLALASPKFAETTGGVESVEWRMVRWQRAWEEIGKSPVIGKGYGGLENAFIFGDRSDYEESKIEIDLASGGVHNGYIAAALALGIPAALFFIYILTSQIFVTGKGAFAWHLKDPMTSEICCFVCANLIAESITIFIGTDLNNPFLWLLLGTGVLMLRLKAKETRTVADFQNRVSSPMPPAMSARDPQTA